jgi:hypothetical protein
LYRLNGEEAVKDVAIMEAIYEVCKTGGKKKLES